MIIIKLKAPEEIIPDLTPVEDDEGSNKVYNTTDGISYSTTQHGIVTPAIIGTEFTLVNVEKDYDVIELEVKDQDNTYYISSKWVESITIDGITRKPTHISDDYITFGKIFYDIKKKKIITDAPICKCCGTMLKKPTSHNICPTCEETLTACKNYSYIPEVFKFNGSQQAADAENPIWYGIELEYGLRTLQSFAGMINAHSDVLYVKSDSSIEGGKHKRELVTHPHSFSELMSDDSFVSKLPSLDNDAQKSANGCHVHISRTAFKDTKHYGLFYFLIQANQQLLEHIGGRKLTRYCQLQPIGKVATKDHKASTGEKSVAVNEKHSDTIEIRVFNSTDKPEVLRTYVQFLDSLIKYTKYHKRQVSLTKWSAYVTKYKSKYPELYASLSELKVSVLENGTVVYKPVVNKTITFDKLKASQLASITGVETSTNTYTVIRPELTAVIGNLMQFYYKDSDGDTESNSVQINDIISITYEV